MLSFKIKDFELSKYEGRVFIVAEIGQNHQGDIEIAKKMIIEAKNAGCDCVKFQKSNLSAKFTKSALQRPYINANSWGTTYQSHKEFLEFTLDQIKELKNFADNEGIYFSASAMDEISLQELTSLDLPFIKIGSGDANNYPLLITAAKLSIPLIISTGMQNLATIDEIVKIMNENKKMNFCLLHCVSSYPTQPKDVNLCTIKLLQERYPNVVIGYSGHEEGILISQASVLLGAKVLERHFTLDKNWKGTDHKCSLTPLELKNLVQSIRTLEEKGYTKTSPNTEVIKQILNQEIDNFSSDDANIMELALKEVNSKVILPYELPCRMKLGKSLVYKSNLLIDDILKFANVAVKVSEPPGAPAERLFEFIGRKLRKNVQSDESILTTDFVA